MITRHVIAVAAVLALSPMAPGAVRAQQADQAQFRQRCEFAVPGKVVVLGEAGARLELSPEELAAMPAVRFDGSFHDGRPARFEGVPLWQLLRQVGVPEALRSGDLTRLVAVQAADGYQAVFALAELSPDFRGEVPLLAFRQEGAPIREGFGPVQVIVPGDQRQARWVRQVECIRLDRWRPRS